MSVVHLEVAGVPQPQGSTRAFVVGGHAVVTHDNRALMPWREAIAWEARHAWAGAPMQGPVSVIVTFLLPRPKSRPKRDRYPDRRPDLDKLVRAVLDGITGVLVADDAQVCDVSATKSYGAWTGAVLTVTELEL